MSEIEKMVLHLKKLVSPFAVAVIVGMTSATALYAQNAGETKDRQIVTEPRQEPANTETTPPAPANTEPAPADTPASSESSDKPATAQPAAAEPADTKPEPKEAVADTPDKLTALAHKIHKPADDVEAKAQDVLAKHCARCHQVGALNRETPAKGLGNILDLKAVALTPNLVVPGNPNGSKLYQQLANQEMPYDLWNEGADVPEPSADEIKALGTWISSLGEKTQLACKDRKFIDNEAIVKLISADLNTIKEHRLAGARYITLSNLYNACVSDEEIYVYRQGVVKLLNSLSQNSDVVKLHTIDEYGTIIRFNLDDLRWTSHDWDLLLSHYPYYSRPDSNLVKFLESATHTPLPYIRGDWFAYTASRPPLYHDLLKLPHTLKGLTSHLKLDMKHNIEKYIAQRAGFAKSGVSVNNRLIERHTISTGVFWTSYDFAGTKKRQSLFDFPLGPGGKYGFKEDGGESIFSLPNGFQAYYLNSAKGKRLDKGPIEIVRDPGRRDQSVTNGISCFGCHDQGIRTAKDDIRNAVLKDRSQPKIVREAVEALYPPHDKMDKLLAQDKARFQTAMKAAGLDPALKWKGVEMINALSNKYEANLDIRIAAAEFGMEQKVFLEAMSAAGAKAHALKQRLQQNVVPRDQFEHFYAQLVPLVTEDDLIDIKGLKVKTASYLKTHAPKKGKKFVKKFVKDYKVAKVHDTPYKVSRKFDLALFSDKTHYHVNDYPVFTVRSSVNCYLELHNVDKTGHGTVIYPNKYQQRNFLKAHKSFKFPGKDAPFDFRLRDPGVETVIAICNASGKSVDGIKHNYRKATFTDLGNYNDRLTRKIVVEAKKIKKLKKVKFVKAHKGKAIVARTAIKIFVK